MKTTINISDTVLDEAREVARREGSTLRALVEEGLRQVLAERASRKPFRLRDASVGGSGPRPELSQAGWDAIRDIIYEDRGT